MDNPIASVSSWREPKVVVTLIGMLLIAGVVALAILRDRIVNQPQWQVSVTGQGKVSYQPDVAIVTLGVQVDKVYQPELALKQLNDKMEKVLAALKGADVPAEDITSQNYSLYPQYDYKDGVSSAAGYSANQQVVVKIKDLKNSDKLSKVVGETTKAGANQITSITFDVSNLNDLKQEARLQAITDAQTKAKSQARVVGVRLGKVVGWWENVVQAPGPQYSYLADGKGGMGGGAPISSPQVPTGNQEVVVEVSLNYRIK